LKKLNTKGGMLMQENGYGLGLYSGLLRICFLLLFAIVFAILFGCSGKSKQAKTTYEIAKVPKIGEIITTERALALCVHYDLNYLAVRIEKNPDHFNDWEFDGCSMTPTEVLSKAIKIPSLAEICLKHDLGYAYGDPGNQAERLKVDRQFQSELLHAGASEYVAKTMFIAVREGGKEELCLSFSWGFARVEPCKLGFGIKVKK
jgi:hypothetical protein